MSQEEIEYQESRQELYLKNTTLISRVPED